MGKTAKSVMSVAEAEIGNAGGKKFWSYMGYSSRVAWCACFVSYCFDKAGAMALFTKTASCFVIADYARTHGLVIPKEQAQYGDVILFDWQPNAQPDHVGFVVCRNADGSFKTLEGNTDDCVAYRTRPASSIYMVIRPKYEKIIFDDDSEAPKLDNTPADWSAADVEWAVSNKILVGNELGDLMLNSPLTREQFVCMLRRYDAMRFGV